MSTRQAVSGEPLRCVAAPRDLLGCSPAPAAVEAGLARPHLTVPDRKDGRA
ncbi:hypothetical protein ACE1SV_67480 [Streptomyces sp. E-15]